jgi:hypothetical protein
MKRKATSIEIGDRVRFLLGTREFVAEVVDDHGSIGLNGRRLVVVSVQSEDGSTETFTVPSEDLALVNANGKTTAHTSATKHRRPRRATA